MTDEPNMNRTPSTLPIGDADTGSASPALPNERMPTVIEGVYALRERVGSGGFAEVRRADVDLERFDYTTLYAYTQVQGNTHIERRRRAEEFSRRLAEQDLDVATIRAILAAAGIPVPGDVVAVKIATLKLKGDLDRFEAEWKNLICLNHENVVKVYGGGTYQGLHYYAMEYIEAIVSPREKLEIILQSARGLGECPET